MTYYHDIKTELQDADKPLSAKELHGRVGGYRTKVYKHLKRMREKGVVITDKDYKEKGVMRYQWRQR